MRRLLIVLFLALLALNTQCGSGGGDGTFSGTTPVTIVFGEVRTGPGTTASLEKGKLVSNIVADDRIAGITVTGRELTICRITITGPGMTDMVTEVEIAGQETISETFKIRSGLNRYLLVEFIDNGNNVLFSADRAGVNLEGEPVEIEVQVEPTGTYLAPPDFPGISSITNATTRSVRLSWEPATDNLTPQDRIQYEIYVSNDSITGREDINTVFDTVYTLSNATVVEGDPLMSYTYGNDNELLLISYDYEGVVPDKGIKSGAVNQGTSTGRLTPGLSYYFIVKAKDEFGRLDEQLVESAAVTVHMLDVTTEGSGTVTSDPPGIDCGSICSEDYLSGTEVALIANPAQGSEFEGWSGSVCSGTENCIITVDASASITADFCQTAAYYRDIDGDSYGDPNNSTQACTQPFDYIVDNSDCNDSNEDINPQAIEVCDSVDNNCDSQIDEGFDNDGDGYTTCGGDCDDSNPAINHGAIEVCDDKIDNDCDTLIDHLDTNCLTCEPGAKQYCNTGQPGVCMDGTETCGANGLWGECLQNVQSSAEQCDGLDNNCNDQVDEGVLVTYYEDSDADGYGNPDITTQSCSQPSGYVSDNTDCDDINDAINPGAAEVCDEIDNNCNGQFDEGVLVTYYADSDADGYGNPGNTTQSCSQPPGYVINNADCNDDDAAINPIADEECDLIDNNCNGQIDEGLAEITYYRDFDNDQYGDQNLMQQSCSPSPPSGYVSDNTDCDDDNAAIYPGAPEVCENEIDENCDGYDDVCPFDCNDKDGDEYGNGTDCLGPDCNDKNPAINPGAQEVCTNKVDDDCDDLVDYDDTEDCKDDEPPDFNGLRSVNLDCGASPDEIDLSWPAATDNVTLTSQIRYMVCWDAEPLFYGQPNPAECVWLTGELKYSINTIDGHNLVEGQTVYIGVTPYDEAGNGALYTGTKEVNVDCQSDAEITGTWDLNYDHSQECSSSPSTAIWYINSDYTYSDSFEYSGTWTTNGSQVTLTYSSGPVYSGTVNGNYMSGTILYTDGGAEGCWTASKN